MKRPCACEIAWHSSDECVHVSRRPGTRGHFWASRYVDSSDSGGEEICSEPRGAGRNGDQLEAVVREAAWPMAYEDSSEDESGWTEPYVDSSAGEDEGCSDGMSGEG